MRAARARGTADCPAAMIVQCALFVAPYELRLTGSTANGECMRRERETSVRPGAEQGTAQVQAHRLARVRGKRCYERRRRRRGAQHGQPEIGEIGEPKSDRKLRSGNVSWPARSTLLMQLGERRERASRLTARV